VKRPGKTTPRRVKRAGRAAKAVAKRAPAGSAKRATTKARAPRAKAPAMKTPASGTTALARHHADLGAVTAEDASLVEVPELGSAAKRAGAQAVSLARSVESLETAYDAWLELRSAHAQLRARFAQERTRLEDQGQLLLGALRAAQPPAGTGDELVRPGDAAAYQVELEAKLAAARAALEAQIAEADASLRGALDELQATVRARVEHRAKLVKPRLRLMLRTLPGERRILHAQRPGGDEAVVLLFVLSGRVPSRYGYLFDDSTDDVQRAPPTLYADEGVTADATRPGVPELRAILERAPAVWPVKATLPMALPPVGGATTLVRWLSRGPVIEAEIEDGATFRNVLSRTEAERITGALLALKLEGRLELELVAG